MTPLGPPPGVGLVAGVAAALAALPAGLTLANLRLFRPPPPPAAGPRPRVSVLVPARNEEPAILLSFGASQILRQAGEGLIEQADQ